MGRPSLALPVALLLTWLAPARAGAQPEPPAITDVPPVTDRAPSPGELSRRERLAALRDSVDVVRDVVYVELSAPGGGHRDLTLDALYPRDRDDLLPAVVYVHGGGYRRGGKSDGLPFAFAFAAGGYLAVTIEYRLASEAPYPAAVDDVMTAIRFLHTHAAELGIDRTRIGVWGHSAGGHLATLVAVTAGDRTPEGELGPVGVACVASVGGPMDFLLGGMDGAEGLAFWLDASGEELLARAAEASPVRHVDADDPPTLLVHGADDRVVAVRQARVMLETLKDAGVEADLLVVPGQGHGVWSAAAYERITRFFDEHLGGDATGAAVDLTGRGPSADR